MQLPKGHSRDWKRRKPSKTTGLQSLDRTLWRWFSKYIRLRDSVEGYALCVSCGRGKPWKEMDAGHFISRNRKATRFNEKNVNAQCPKCNRFLSGRQFEHGLRIDSKWGKGTAEKLLALSTQRCKLDRMWYEYMIEEYKKKVKELLNITPPMG